MVKLNCELHAGAAQVDITPEIGISLTGYIAREGKSIGVHDPLYATTLVLSDNHKLAAIISCDLVALDEPFVRSTREKIQSATGIPFRKYNDRLHSYPLRTSYNLSPRLW